MIDLTALYDLIGRLLPLDCMQARFMQQALVALVLLAPMCAAMGVQVVNFRMAFFSDAISHSAFAGVALGLILGLDARWTMVGLAVLVGLGIVAVGRRSSLSIDVIIGVFFSAIIAFGLAVVSRDRSVARDVQRFLYGDILTIGDADILLLVGLGCGADGLPGRRLQPPAVRGAQRPAGLGPPRARAGVSVSPLRRCCRWW